MNDWDFFDDKPEVTYQPQQPAKRNTKKVSPKWPKYILILFIALALLGALLGSCEDVGRKSDFIKRESNNADKVEKNNTTTQKVVEENENGDAKEFAYYYYNQLSAGDKETYELIFNAMYNMETTVRIQETDKRTMGYIMEMIMADHPELFWCNGVYTYTTYENYTDFSPSYICDEWAKSVYQREIDDIVNEFLGQINEDMSDYEKVKDVFEYIVDNVDYVTGAPNNQNIYSSIVSKKSVCAGYTREMQYLLQQMGIETLYVSGMVDGTESHSWNIVKCDGKYYQVDPTFGDRASNDNGMGNLPDELHINYDYLCCTDKKIYADRKTDMTCALPVCNSNDLNYYQMQGTYYEYYSQDVLEDLEKAIFSGEKIWQCQFENQQDYQTMLSIIENGALADIVGKYWTSMGYDGRWTSWHMGEEKMYTIFCWY